MFCTSPRLGRYSTGGNKTVAIVQPLKGTKIDEYPFTGIDSVGV